MNKVLNSGAVTLFYKWALPLPFLYYILERLITNEGFVFARDWFFLLFSVSAVLMFKFRILTLLDQAIDIGDSVFVKRGRWQATIPFEKIIEFETDGLNVIIHPKETGEFPKELHFIRSFKQPAFGTLDLVSALNKKTP